MTKKRKGSCITVIIPTIKWNSSQNFADMCLVNSSKLGSGNLSILEVSLFILIKSFLPKMLPVILNWIKAQVRKNHGLYTETYMVGLFTT